MPHPQHGALGFAFTATRALQLVSLITIMGMTARFISELVDSSETPPAPLVAVLSITCLAILYVCITFILYWDSQLPYLAAVALDSCFFLALMVASIIIGKPLSFLSCGSATSAAKAKVETVMSELASPATSTSPAVAAATPVVTSVAAAAATTSAAVQAFAETTYQTITTTLSGPASTVLPDTLVAATLAPGTSGTEVTGSDGNVYKVVGARAVGVISSGEDLFGVRRRSVAIARDVTETVMKAIDYDAWVRTSGRTCMMMKAVWGFGIVLTVLFIFSAACMAFLWKRQRTQGPAKVEDE